MWNDLVTKFNDIVAAVNDWVYNGQRLLFAAIPTAAFVYFVVSKLRKSAKRRSTNRKREVSDPTRQ